MLKLISKPYRDSNVIYHHKPLSVRPVCAVTIDDAPCDSRLIINLLDWLKENNIKLTFFIISSYIKEDSEKVIRRLVEDGHELGNHMVKNRSYRNVPLEEFERELLECEEKIKRYDPSWVEGTNIKWFRPPNGQLTEGMLQILRRHGYRTAMADVYASDSQAYCFPKWIKDFTVKWMKSGSITILHCPNYRKRQDSASVVKSTIQTLVERGFFVTTLSRLVNF